MNIDCPCAAISRNASLYAAWRPDDSWPDRTANSHPVSDSPQLVETVLATFWLAAVKNPSENP